MRQPLVVSIGMTHPQNSAGIGLDVRIAAEYGVRHAIVVAAVSAQDERGVQRIVALPPDFIMEQLGAARVNDADAVRVGALGSSENLQIIWGMLCEAPMVVDPVLRSSAGGALYVDDPLPLLRKMRIGARMILTPNIDETRELTGVQVGGVAEMIAGGRRLIEQGAGAVLVTGGHLPADPVDVLVTENAVETFAGARLPQRMRGTGCTLAMALACEMALGRDIVTAVQGARAYVRANIARS